MPNRNEPNTHHNYNDDDDCALKIFFPVFNGFLTSAVGMLGYAFFLIGKEASNNSKLAENTTYTWLTFLGAAMAASTLTLLANSGIAKLPINNGNQSRLSVTSYFSFLSAATILISKAFDSENNINYYPAAQLATGHVALMLVMFLLSKICCKNQENTDVVPHQNFVNLMNFAAMMITTGVIRTNETVVTGVPVNPPIVAGTTLYAPSDVQGYPDEQQQGTNTLPAQVNITIREPEELKTENHEPFSPR